MADPEAWQFPERKPVWEEIAELIKNPKLMEEKKIEEQEEKSKRVTFTIYGFSRKIRDACTAHTRSLGQRGNARYIERLIKKDIALYK